MFFTNPLHTNPCYVQAAPLCLPRWRWTRRSSTGCSWTLCALGRRMACASHASLACSSSSCCTLTAIPASLPRSCRCVAEGFHLLVGNLGGWAGPLYLCCPHCHNGSAICHTPHPVASTHMQAHPVASTHMQAHPVASTHMQAPLAQAIAKQHGFHVQILNPCWACSGSRDSTCHLQSMTRLQSSPSEHETLDFSLTTLRQGPCLKGQCRPLAFGARFPSEQWWCMPNMHPPKKFNPHPSWQNVQVEMCSIFWTCPHPPYSLTASECCHTTKACSCRQRLAHTPGYLAISNRWACWQSPDKEWPCCLCILQALISELSCVSGMLNKILFCVHVLQVLSDERIRTANLSNQYGRR